MQSTEMPDVNVPPLSFSEVWSCSGIKILLSSDGSLLRQSIGSPLNCSGARSGDFPARPVICPRPLSSGKNVMLTTDDWNEVPLPDRIIQQVDMARRKQGGKCPISRPGCCAWYLVWDAEFIEAPFPRKKLLVKQLFDKLFQQKEMEFDAYQCFWWYDLMSTPHLSKDESKEILDISIAAVDKARKQRNWWVGVEETALAKWEEDPTGFSKSVVLSVLRKKSAGPPKLVKNVVWLKVLHHNPYNWAGVRLRPINKLLLSWGNSLKTKISKKFTNRPSSPSSRRTVAKFNNLVAPMPK
eukprot:TRINITY_DN28432_c0_g1_i1.p1 TRINITY_DN28432_c0_g1~~TRINITY_DN28432_c0_g1_i1.p1  ORF type:complete len:297 (-),score=15.61 TRINITY_DN28432_c0_g1_i1:64-954(-)